MFFYKIIKINIKLHTKYSKKKINNNIINILIIRKKLKMSFNQADLAVTHLKGNLYKFESRGCELTHFVIWEKY